MPLDRFLRTQRSVPPVSLIGDELELAEKENLRLLVTASESEATKKRGVVRDLHIRSSDFTTVKLLQQNRYEIINDLFGVPFLCEFLYINRKTFSLICVIRYNSLFRLDAFKKIFSLLLRVQGRGNDY